MNKKLKIATILGTTALVGFLGYGYFSGNGGSTTSNNSVQEDVQKIYVPVTKSSFNSSVKTLGTTKLTNEQRLRFNTAGIITAVNVKAGDQIKKGDLIASIGSTEAQTEIERAKISVENAQSDLNKFVEDVNTTGIAKMRLNIKEKKLQIADKKSDITHLETKQKQTLKDLELSLQEAKNNLQLSKEQSEKNIAELGHRSGDEEKNLAERILQLKQDALEYSTLKSNFDKRLEQKLNDYYIKLKTNYTAVEGERISLEEKLTEIGRLVKVGKKRSEPVVYKVYFSAQKVEQRSKIKEELKNAFTNLEELNKSFVNLKDVKDKEEIIKLLQAKKKFFETYSKLANAVAIGYQNSIDTSTFEPKGYVDSYLSEASGAVKTAEEITQTIDELQTVDTVAKMKADLENDLRNKELALEKAKVEIEKMKENKKYVTSTVDTNIQSEKLKVEKEALALKDKQIEIDKLKRSQKTELEQERITLARLQLDFTELKKERARLLDLSGNTEYKMKKNSVKQAQASLNDTLKKLDNYVLRAPFDGKVSKVEVVEGDRLNEDTQKYIYLINPNSIEVNVKINQSDVTKIQQGMKAEVTMKAYPDKVFEGTLIEVDTTPKEENGLVQFKAKVVLEKPEGVDIYSGLSANVKIITQKIDDALVVPFSAVKTDADGKNYVTVQGKTGEEEKKMVEVGYTDGKLYQIKSGLQEGEEVLEIDYSQAGKTKKKKKDTQRGQGQGEENYNEEYGDDPYGQDAGNYQMGPDDMMMMGGM